MNKEYIVAEAVNFAQRAAKSQLQAPRLKVPGWGAKHSLLCVTRKEKYSSDECVDDVQPKHMIYHI